MQQPKIPGLRATQVGTGTVKVRERESCGLLFPTANSRPVPLLFSVPAVYHPAAQRLVSGPLVFRPTVCPVVAIRKQFLPFYLSQ